MTPDDYARQERAAIMEFDGGLSREEAEQRAAKLHPQPDTINKPPPNVTD